MRKLLTREAVERVEAMLATAEGAGLSMLDIARDCGINTLTVHKIREGDHYWQQTPTEQRRRDGVQNAPEPNSPHYLPTEQEIRRHCRRFLKLNPRRSEYSPTPYELPRWRVCADD